MSSPYPDGVLPADHQAAVAHVRSVLQDWLLAAKDHRAHISGGRERLGHATAALADLDVPPPYAFAPAPPYIFRAALLSATRAYWLALVASLSAAERTELAARLDLTPPYEGRVPRFDGARCVGAPGALGAAEYEGLMRTVHLVAMGMVADDVRKSWDELGEVGVQNWEERD